MMVLSPLSHPQSFTRLTKLIFPLFSLHTTNLNVSPLWEQSERFWAGGLL